MEAGVLLGRLQEGERLGMPHSRPMPEVGPRCHELRIRDENKSWRIVYRVDSDAILIAAVFSKTTPKTSKHDIEDCYRRLREYDAEARRAARGKRP
jgi:phage-related protein